MPSPPALPDEVYGLWVIAPAVLAIVLAIVLRQVVPALVVGIFAAAMMYLPWSHPVEPGGFVYNPITGVVATVETYLIGTLQDVDHLMILVFTFSVGGVVEIISVNGGTGAMVELIGRWARDRRRGQLAGWMAGVAVFFGDYPNMLIVGPTMRPVCDRLRISRAKLAYIVDSTAAPIASLALVGEWVAVQVGYIQDGLRDVVASDPESWVAGYGAFGVFVGSIPLRYYSLFAIAMVFLIGFLGRDFGPMLRAERRAVGGEDDVVEPMNRHTARHDNAGPTSSWLAIGPILVLLIATLVLLVVTGLAAMPDKAPVSVAAIMAHAESSRALMYATLLTLLVALGISLAWRRLTLAEAMDAIVVGFNRMLIAAVILSLAWALSDAMRSLELAQVATAHLRDVGVSARLLPLLVFLTAAGVSFSTGTSWGTMGILMPVTVSVVAELATGLPAEAAGQALYASVGSVLAGAVFGDHCSPISDTTVLSAAATQSTIEDHVWTQMPYALVAAGVAIVAGHLLCDLLGLNPAIGLAMGIAGLAVIIRVLGRSTLETR